MTSSFIMGFLLGFSACAVLQYVAQFFTDRRDAREEQMEKENELDLLFETHFDFFNQMKNDVEDPTNAHVREFFVVNKEAIMSSSQPRLRYDLSDDVVDVLERLDELEYITRIPNDSLLYKIEEEFVDELRSLKVQKQEIELLNQMPQFTINH